MALFAALAVALGYALVSVPNLELVTLVFFLSGFFLGPLSGVVTAAVGEFLYSTFNPLGAAPFPILLAQILGMSLVAAAGGLSAHFLRSFFGDFAEIKRIRTRRWIFFLGLYFGALGFLLTLSYDFLTTLTPLLFSGLTLQKLIGSIVYGMGFYVAHIGLNTLIFALLGPIVVIKVSPYLASKGRK